MVVDLFSLWTRLEMSAGKGRTVFIPNVPLSSSEFPAYEKCIKLGEDRQINPRERSGGQTRTGRVERIEMIITMGLIPRNVLSASRAREGLCCSCAVSGYQH